MLENREYCKCVVKEIEKYYNGEVKDDSGEPLNLYDYLMDCLDYEYIIDSKKNYKSARIWVSLGGPNVWIDLEERAVKLAWGTDRAECALDWDICNEIEDIMQEIYES